MGESDRPFWPHIRKVTEVYHTGWFGLRGRAVLDCQHVIDFDGEQQGPKVGELRSCRFCVQIDQVFKAQAAKYSGYRAGEKLRMATAGLRTPSTPLDFRTIDHPAANGRTPTEGEHGIRFNFPLEDGRTLFIDVGREGFASLLTVILSYMLDVQTHIADRQEDRER